MRSWKRSSGARFPSGSQRSKQTPIPRARGWPPEGGRPLQSTNFVLSISFLDPVLYLQTEDVVRRDEVLSQLKESFPRLQVRHGVASLGLFGSVARDEAGPESDVDLLVSFTGEPTFAAYMGLKEDLELLLGCRVDLVTPAGLKPRIRDRVLSELLHVA